jgi:hypothetical protein
MRHFDYYNYKTFSGERGGVIELITPFIDRK